MHGGSRLDLHTGANTYITQMAQVDMEMRKKDNPTLTPQKVQKRANSLSSLVKPIKAKPATFQTAAKLSHLLNATDHGLRNYLEAKR